MHKRGTKLSETRRHLALRTLIQLLRTRAELRRASENGVLAFALNHVVRNPANGRKKRTTAALLKLVDGTHGRMNPTLQDALAQVAGCTEIERKIARTVPMVLGGTNGKVIATIDVRTCLRSPSKAMSRLTAELWSDYLVRESMPSYERHAVVVLSETDQAASRCSQVMELAARAMKSNGGPYDGLKVVFV